jgi:hypothetical protein
MPIKAGSLGPGGEGFAQAWAGGPRPKGRRGGDFYHEEELIALSAVATVPLIARNLLFALLVVLLQVHARRASGRAAREASLSRRH